MNIETKLQQLLEVLDDAKLSEIKQYIPPHNESDSIIIATARSSTHLNACAENVRLDAKQMGFDIIGVEGVGTNWAIVDLAFVVIHIMLAEAREYYSLDKLFVGDD